MGNDDRINYLNIALMAVSALAAFYIPFPLFLFSYAVLGPLHYLTEISWLHQRGYFTRRKGDAVPLALLAAAVMVLGVGLNRVLDAMQVQQLNSTVGFFCLFAAFGGALVFATVKEWPRRAVAFVGLALAGLWLRTVPSAQLAFQVFLPTLLHVFLFTGAFMLYGALKSRSRSGMLQCGAFVAIPLLMWLCNEQGRGWVLSDRILDSYFPPTPGGGAMGGLHKTTIETLHLGETKTRQDVLYSSYGALVGRFVAYAYTYHYLNWFSKTSLIGWHKVSKPRLAAVVVFWVASMALYAHDYRLGLKVLYGLSFLHVFLEFPLNHVSLLGIGREASAWWRARRGVAPILRSG